MTPYFDQNLVTLYQGDCRAVLAELPDASVNCCVTSPPYWGLRDYGTASWEGGDIECDHAPPDDAGKTTKPTNGQRQHAGRFAGPECFKCGARRVDLQIGLEPTPELYVQHIIEIFREVRRVLRDDGTLWLNLGDSYNAQPGQRKVTDKAGEKQQTNRGAPGAPSRSVDGLKPKDLIGIPWRVAFALQADGWYLRQDIIWHKPNPMPESVTDRCTKSHEYIFLLSKSERYHCDMESIKESSITNDIRRPYTSAGAWQIDGRPVEQQHGGEPRSFKGSKFNTGKTATHMLGRSSKKPRTAGNKTHKYVTEYEGSESEEHRTKAGLLKVSDVPWEARNRRSVWTVSTKPYSAAHFATFPPDLIDPCVAAGCPSGGVVLDPFFGAGTTGLVSQRHGVRCIGVELNASYCEIARKRLAQGVLCDTLKIQTALHSATTDAP